MPKVLIVDDNEFNASVLKTKCEESKTGVVVAKNGEEAVNFFREDLNKNCICPYRFSLILMDIEMPVKDGF